MAWRGREFSRTGHFRSRTVTAPTLAVCLAALLHPALAKAQSGLEYGVKAASISEIPALLRGKPVLTVSEVPGFCERGGAMNLQLADSQDGEKVLRFEINPTAGERVGLRFSSKLLSLARLVMEANP